MCVVHMFTCKMYDMNVTKLVYEQVLGTTCTCVYICMSDVSQCLKCVFLKNKLLKELFLKNKKILKVCVRDASYMYNYVVHVYTTHDKNCYYFY